MNSEEEEKLDSLDYLGSEGWVFIIANKMYILDHLGLSPCSANVYFGKQQMTQVTEFLPPI